MENNNLDENQASNQPPSPSAGPEPNNVPTTPVANEPIKSQQKNKRRIIAILVVALLVFVAFDWLRAVKFSTSINKYESSAEFQDYKKSMIGFAVDNDSRLAKVYSCQSDTDALWARSTVNGTPYSTPEAYVASTNVIRAQQASVKTGLPAVPKGMLIAKVIPGINNGIKKHDDTQKLINATQSVLNAGPISGYCYSAYSKVDYFGFVNNYSRKIDDSVPVSDYQAQLKIVQNFRKEAEKMPVPNGMTGSHEHFIGGIKDVEQALQEVITQRQSNASTVNSHTGFAVAKSALDKSFKEMSVVGRQIHPQPYEIKSLVSNIK